MSRAGWAFASIGLGMALALLAACGAPPNASQSAAPSALAVVPTDPIMRQRMAMLSAERGMEWESDGAETWIGTAPDGHLTLVGVPVIDVTLIVPAATAEEAFDAVVRYNVAIEAMIGSPPGLSRGWVEGQLESWTGAAPLNTVIQELGFDVGLRSSGDPRIVTLTIHRNPGAWEFEPCQGDLPAEPDATRIVVYFMCDPPPADPRPVSRTVDAPEPVDRLRAAVLALFEGPTDVEIDAGYEGPVPHSTPPLVREVELNDDGLAIVDFDDRITKGLALNSSANRFILFGTLGRTIAQVPEVQAVEYRIMGSCDAFEAYFEGTCGYVREGTGELSPDSP